ncbi:hypothetical protein [Mycolicibacterium fluoranthenivorans]|uniref:Uncharacterized protein n=1 Tax=Mycolicibacterium fluoranthenivorans TaxID=258505 RepID=A0A7X5TUG6_9MYCO|nr:hypothetical protein [Mycolicibacterium fluoranthenivorans]MCV7358647.1 hypothetical protein [Mycolicibacterium fluoranthenivorans]NIH93360.1 hypothetical protein [Mycolicibacterium fluoranthenivorans]
MAASIGAGTHAGTPGPARRLVMTRLVMMLWHVLAREWIAESGQPDPGVRRRRYYPPRRDRVIEEAAMSREMYRL